MMKKERAEALRAAWASELQNVARELGYVPNMNGDATHPIVRILGSLAWGRYHHEPAASGDTKDRVLRGLGYLEGVRDAAMRAARERGDKKADKLLCSVPDKVRRRVYG